MQNKLIVFDLDGTLTESKSELTERMAQLFSLLLKKYEVAVISGCAIEQFENQFILPLVSYSDPFPRLSSLFLLPTCGSQLYEHAGREAGFTRMYHNDLILREKVEIYNAWLTVIKECDFGCGPKYGEVAEDRGSQITFSMCGQEAPLSVKKKFDPSGTKRLKIIEKMKKELYGKYEVSMGGTTSIDVTRAGIDKAYGIKKLLEWEGNYTEKDIIFIGDALHPGGNDSAVKKLDIVCVPTTGPDETAKIIEKLNNNITEF